MSDANPSEEPTAPRPGTSPGRRLARNLALYTLARLVLVAILTVVIMVVAAVATVQIPLIVAILFAIVIALPLSLTLFKGLRGKVNSDIAAVDERRRRDKAQLRARLRGDTTAEEPVEPAAGESGTTAERAPEADKKRGDPGDSSGPA
ncbi:DUF4229 domain-containing protein [Nocardia jinanensis]|uniref:DUF4229 domain-containing protein n=1 Tax=Nocardia jinanensis TaxID=382504 RepID=A0A917RX02_9NOCA|nr:DUF4229 domain-containing protein [Nocardia jinanensis]GGL43460.1 hypothetical protein GCM10011588_67800 [Nocardia jinanensis]